MYFSFLMPISFFPIFQISILLNLFQSFLFHFFDFFSEPLNLSLNFLLSPFFLLKTIKLTSSYILKCSFHVHYHFNLVLKFLEIFVQYFRSLIFVILIFTFLNILFFYNFASKTEKSSEFLEEVTKYKIGIDLSLYIFWKLYKSVMISWLNNKIIFIICPSVIQMVHYIFLKRFFHWITVIELCY